MISYAFINILFNIKSSGSYIGIYFPLDKRIKFYYHQFTTKTYNSKIDEKNDIQRIDEKKEPKYNVKKKIKKLN